MKMVSRRQLSNVAEHNDWHKLTHKLNDNEFLNEFLKGSKVASIKGANLAVQMICICAVAPD